MVNKELVPSAPLLIESMRSIGYSFESAVADIVDNSISAKATDIKIQFETFGKPYLIVFDNGCGMSSLDLIEAMRYGSKNPNDKRTADDLGRFGLGMKSASLSQCRKLTVISKKNNRLSSCCWDLDEVARSKEWYINVLSPKEIDDAPELLDLMDEVKHGTYVLWENFDRVKSGTDTMEKTMNSLMSACVEHLALVFHMYTSKGINITVNGTPLPKRDPFLTDNLHTTVKRPMTYFVKDQKITVRPYVLPQINYLTRNDYELAGGAKSLREDQGFYIYRNNRLIIWGTWFHLERKGELSKLARVRVDIPNTMDDVWKIDIKKNNAFLPDIIRNNLEAALKESYGTSYTKTKFKGRKRNGGIVRYWDRIKNDNTYSFKINRNAPAIEDLRKSLNDIDLAKFDRAINYIESTLPITNIYADKAEGIIDESKADEQSMLIDLQEYYDLLVKMKSDINEGLRSFISMEPYCYSDVIQKKAEGMMVNE